MSTVLENETPELIDAKALDSAHQEKLLAAREEFFEALEHGGLTIPQTVRMMRKTTGMTIPEFAQFVGVSKRYLGDIERGLMNPTVDVLEKIGQPMGLVVALRRRPA